MKAGDKLDSKMKLAPGIVKGLPSVKLERFQTTLFCPIDPRWPVRSMVVISGHCACISNTSINHDRSIFSLLSLFCLLENSQTNWWNICSIFVPPPIHYSWSSLQGKITTLAAMNKQWKGNRSCYFTFIIRKLHCIWAKKKKKGGGVIWLSEKSIKHAFWIIFSSEHLTSTKACLNSWYSFSRIGPMFKILYMSTAEKVDVLL